MSAVTELPIVLIKDVIKCIVNKFVLSSQGGLLFMISNIIDYLYQNNKETFYVMNEKKNYL